MKNADWPSRLFDAAPAAFFGALPGLLCFWLYGLRMSHALPSRAVETGRLDAWWHWVLGMAGGFAVPGLVLRERAADSVGMLISALRDIERLRLPGGRSGFGWTLLALAVWTGALWLAAPS